MKSPAITNSARGKECQFRLPGICNGNHETVVFCHAPSRSGMAKKSPDYWGAYGCHACHAVMDRQDRRYVDFDLNQIWMDAICRTQAILVNAGLLLFPTKAIRSKPVKKTVQRSGLYRAAGE